MMGGVFDDRETATKHQFIDIIVATGTINADLAEKVSV